MPNTGSQSKTVAVARARQRGYRIIPCPDKKRIDIGSVYSSYYKIRMDLGWQPKVTLREGLKETLSFYEKHKKHYW